MKSNGMYDKSKSKIETNKKQ
ncbi:hypothetical protein CNEO4_1260096 [Clostridium neonatale]|nr:hypothetical protein CNEO4_1260096 [Clostridium neonatale]CAI3581963.1 hypothetical protein CNEO4_200111 [Clostridium neonatale]CAI3656361.1 hypothetical protein CNEO4_400002 [Clostridium neonatale]CAI4142140.1 hypothetical protein CNEO4_850004 [Clostridium neonatale]